MIVRAALALTVLSMGLPAPAPAASATETAVFAGGCFWGMEMVFERLRGVTAVMPGYSGGNADTAHYEMVSTGTTGHAESVRVTFDPKQISYEQLLRVYFLVAHDPTELNYQGPDEGTQYRSEIFYIGEAQKAAATAMMRQLTAAHTFHAPIVTKLEAYRAFFPAEEYHRHFGDKNPTYPYIVVNDQPKVAELEKQFPQLVRHG